MVYLYRVLPAPAVTATTENMKSILHHTVSLCAAAILITSSDAGASADSPPFTVRRVSGAKSQQVVSSVPTTIAGSVRVKSSQASPPQSAGVRVVGDNVADPFVVNTLPFNDDGATTAMTDDYHQPCPFPLGGAPDVVYRYIPASNQVISIDLCESLYDTKVYVYENAVSPGAPFACNDDYCGPEYVQSYIPSLPLSEGQTYYIVVDGYGSFSGSYSITIAEDVACVWAGCAPGATSEGEPCATGVDVTNGGCSNLLNLQFSEMEFGSTICGHMWAELPDRDTDWYRVTLPADALTNWRVSAEFPLSIFIFDLSYGCDSLLGIRFDADPCEEISVDFETVVAGDYALVVTTRDQFGGYPCSLGPWQYNTTLEVMCDCDCHADPYEIPAGSGTCDGLVDVLDVIQVVNIAFRGSPFVADPNVLCPYSRTDANCDNQTDILDVTAFVNVTFRGASPAAIFCSPCVSP